ncbi:hypothetical protein B0172_04650 [Mycobacterium avium subsp. paratuberculosis]|nr:hypothetical protein B0172_04650 [Mycobacterium avium subsp. paratuberculosis]CAG6935410.1 hypothetical protein PICSAR118_04460 [Mycobacterium avium subsp. paratuberculosis]CAG6938884.1 hypothetical protein PICSAR10_04564 [Mycobacterium avium subsp. paratuberculosis]CAG6939269.1 hypothetical protein PICSAR124_04486 [Mycobacterium avium subsp. paratuberculosis]CAG7023941.1 hypothetical protein PICSAR14_04468 [Mycobacterium avium subsp. paratuberculosis]
MTPSLIGLSGNEFRGSITDHATFSSSPLPERAATAAASCSADTARVTSSRTDSTGTPDASASSTDTAPAPAGANLTRTRDAPAACRLTPCQENGNTVSSRLSATPNACNAASSSTGWMPKRPVETPACSGNSTSANVSAPRRHTARNPRKAGPYP